MGRWTELLDFTNAQVVGIVWHFGYSYKKSRLATVLAAFWEISFATEFQTNPSSLSPPDVPGKHKNKRRKTRKRGS
jgi:hypothetical protein